MHCDDVKKQDPSPVFLPLQETIAALAQSLDAALVEHIAQLLGQVIIGQRCQCFLPAAAKMQFLAALYLHVLDVCRQPPIFRKRLAVIRKYQLPVINAVKHVVLLPALVVDQGIENIHRQPLFV